METLFELPISENETCETCRTCKHRQRFALNEKSNKIVQCCDIQPSKRSNSGYKTIKVTNKACEMYERSKHNNQRSEI